MNYIYGLDLSMSCSGIVVAKMETKCSPEIVLIDSIKTKSKDTHGIRLGEQREFFDEIYSLYPPREIAIESGFTRFNKSTQVLYRVHGVVNELFKNCTQFYYPPTTVKKTITGKGNSGKDSVQHWTEVWLKENSSLRTKNEDESDALAVLLTHLTSHYNCEI